MQRPTTSLCVLNLTKFKDNISQSKKKKKKCSKKSDWIYTHLKKQYERCVHSESSTLETKERQEEKATCFYCVSFFLIPFHFVSLLYWIQVDQVYKSLYVLRWARCVLASYIHIFVHHNVKRKIFTHSLTFTHSHRIEKEISDPTHTMWRKWDWC